MSWTIYPAIDMKEGKCVRLFQGDYQKETIYGDPLEVAYRWEKEGAKWIHLVDLDGAKEGQSVQKEIVKSIVESLNIPIQIGGGIRSLRTIEEYLSIGIKRLILGTIALENQELLKEALKMAPDAIAVGIDARNGYVATRGWLDTSQIKAIELGKRLVDIGIKTFIFTDIAKDGTLSGPSINATRNFAIETKAKVIASGGVSSLTDLIKLKELENDGVIGAIVGKALYTGHISFADAFNKLNKNE